MGFVTKRFFWSLATGKYGGFWLQNRLPLSSRILFPNATTYLFSHLFTYLLIHLFIHLFIYLFIYLSIYLFIQQYKITWWCPLPLLISGSNFSVYISHLTPHNLPTDKTTLPKNGRRAAVVRVSPKLIEYIQKNTANQNMS